MCKHLRTGPAALLIQQRQMRISFLVVFMLGMAPAARAQGKPPRRAGHPARTLAAFASDKELAAYLDTMAARAVARARAQDSVDGCTFNVSHVSAVNAAAAGAQPGSAVIRGTVTDPSGKPIPGAAITIPSLSVGASTTANGRGTFLIPQSRIGSDSMLITVRHIGYRPAVGRVLLAAGDTVSVAASLCAQPMMLSEAVVTGAAVAAPAQVTNVQQQGVDEGDIVKLAGHYLVILRRGRLFTLDLGNAGSTTHKLVPRAAVDAFGPDVDPRGTWYDELLVYGTRVVVVGYSYQRGGTELSLFRLAPNGDLRFEGTYQLRSSDYYSSRNYASRLVGSRLVFYAPLRLASSASDLAGMLPALRQWRPGAQPTDFHPVVATHHIYRPLSDTVTGSVVMMHSVTTCDLARPTFTCDARIVVGPPGHVFYVSPTAVYLWTSRPSSARDTTWSASRSIVYRVPLNGSAPSAIRASGSPVDQLALLESRDGYLNALVRADARGEWMWRGEHAAGSAALLRFPVGDFGDGTSSVPRSRYRTLPVDSTSAPFQERFVGEWLLYGVGNSWGRAHTTAATLYAVRLSGGDVTRLPLAHGIDRIDALGRDAIVVGTDGRDLHFDGVDLERNPTLAQHFVLANAAQGELRTHGFAYHDGGDGTGLLGLPVRATGQPGAVHLIEGSASVLFLRNADHQFGEAGALAAHAGIPESVAADACKASCVDWYGNARPLFVGPRVFALLGYEIVEGRMEGGHLTELQRTDFAPHQESTDAR